MPRPSQVDEFIAELDEYSDEEIAALYGPDVPDQPPILLRKQIPAEKMTPIELIDDLKAKGYPIGLPGFFGET